tara:strand:+ start:566 stop:1372 length:807 start_codon:yes stop_codon:yes gene_type:complete
MINKIPKIKFTNKTSFFLIAGPCVVENKKMIFETCENIINITNELQIPFIFKSSYKKANRSQINSFQGIGNKKALEILLEVSRKFNVPITTDIHSKEEAILASKYVDILQIPAFLCRQTDLLVAAAKTNKFINIKKGQFMSHESIGFAINKVKKYNKKVMITERGSCFGYNDLIVDFTGLEEMKKYKIPVILDASHATQKTNQKTGITGGSPKFIKTLSKAGIAIGVNGIFIETHLNPKKALSDSNSMLDIKKLKSLLKDLLKINQAV